MLNSRVLEVTIGMVVCFACVSLLASSLYETIASIWKLRAGSLLKGIKALLNDPTLTGLANAVYNHAMVNPESPGTTEPGQKPAIKPSYIDPKHFAIALIDSVQAGGQDFAALGTKIKALPEGQIKQLLSGIYARADGKIESVYQAVGSWFDAAMDRLSGTYKRWAQLWTFLIGLVVAAALNIDSVYVFGSLWHTQTQVATSINAASTPTDALGALNGLPIGWFKFDHTRNLYALPLGWILTAAAVLFGAPFWFGLLQRLVNLRGTGKKPAPMEDETPKAAP